ncbi:unnamed protein product [Coregonus sp. 'balchen']|nr:unnamed protein product [Coregonus sp. 'balchen']
MRWNLRLHGIPEQAGDDITGHLWNCHSRIKSQTSGKCGHCSSLKDQDKSPRTTIIRFTNRSTQALLMRRAKNCEFLIKQKCWFTEELTSADKVPREKLWPMVAAARKAGKAAFFVGARVIIDGKEMRPNQNI